MSRSTGYSGPVRRLFPTAVVSALALAAVAIAGCGSSSSASGSAGSPSDAAVRQAELSYFPAGSPLILSLQTNPKSSAIQNVLTLIGHFPVAGFAEQALLQKVQQYGINYSTQIKPLLGTPVSVGLGTSATGLSTSNLLVVWKLGTPGRVAALVNKTPGLTKTGSSGGVTFYKTTGKVVAAVDGGTILMSGTQQNISAAIQRHASGGGFSASDYQRLTSSLPADPLLQVFGDLRGLLGSARSANAQPLPWLAALRGYGVTVNSTGSSLDLSYRIDTGGAALSASQLPLASGASAPSFAGSMPITVALSSPAQTLSFVLAAVRQTSSSQLAGVPPAALSAVSALASQLTGSAIVASDLHTTMFRAQLSNPTSGLAELKSLVANFPSAKAHTAKAHGANTHVAKPAALGGGFYRYSGVTFGIAGGKLLIGQATTAQLTTFASAPSTPASGSQGAAAFKVNLIPLISLALKGSSLGGSSVTALLPSVLSQLGNLTGSLTASATALTGQASIPVH